MSDPFSHSREAAYRGNRGLAWLSPGELLELRRRYRALLSDPDAALPVSYIRSVLAEIDGLLSDGEAAA